MQQVIAIMNDYGYLFLVLSMALGIIILPVPLEAIMGSAGFLSYNGDLDWILCILAAAFGTTIGMFVNYWIGTKIGIGFLKKYGRYMFLKPERFDKLSFWFLKYGNSLLLIVFFIPGARHVIGYFAGITKLPFKIYAIYSIIGSILWTTPFVLLGKIIGPGWEIFHEELKKYLLEGSIALAILVFGIYFIHKYDLEINRFRTRIWQNWIKLFR